MGRSAGATDFSRPISAARSRGRPVTGAVSPFMIFRSRSGTGVPASYGALSVNSSCSSSPKAYMSLATVSGSPRTCSGLMQVAVPATFPGAVLANRWDASSGGAKVGSSASAPERSSSIPGWSRIGWSGVGGEPEK